MEDREPEDRPQAHQPPPDLPGDDEALARFPQLAGPRAVTVLPGGITNRNLKVETPTGTSVLRISSPSTGLLAIDRDAEHRNAVIAAEAGVGGPVLDYRPGEGLMLVGWITGRTLTDEDLRDEATLARVARTCRRLHAAPPFANRFDMFEVQARYLATVLERGFRLPEDYLALAPRVEQLRAALAVRPEPVVPCHNDLLAANILDDGERMWLIDYEYSGTNDPCFELGNIWAEADLPLGHLELLVSEYYGGPTPARTARARLLALMSRYGWTLWASIQDGVSTIDFDFWTWGLAKYERAHAELLGPDFERLLDQAANGD